MSESKKGPEICDVISAKCFSVCEINPMITTIMITRNTCIACRTSRNLGEEAPKMLEMGEKERNSKLCKWRGWVSAAAVIM